MHDEGAGVLFRPAHGARSVVSRGSNEQGAPRKRAKPPAEMKNRAAESGVGCPPGRTALPHQHRVGRISAVLFFRRKFRMKIAVYVLLAIGVRAFVASGWMLQFPSSGESGSPRLVICPRQAPAISAWLSDQTLEHHHHHHHDTDDAEPDGASLSVLDPGCALWAGSALGVAASAHSVPLQRVETPTIHDRPQFILERRGPNQHPARAPPFFS